MVNTDPLMWRIVDGRIVAASPTTMRLEKHVEDLVDSDPSCLGKPLFIVGRQDSLAELRSADRLAIDATGTTHVIEFKRAEANRNTIGQVMEYFAWLETLSTDDIFAIFARYRPDVDLAEAFFEKVGYRLPAVLNETQAISIVAATVDPQTERSIRSLKRRGFPITLFGYRYYEDLGAIQFLPYPLNHHESEHLFATKGLVDPGVGRPVSAGELARWQASLDRFGAGIEAVLPTLETLRRPSSAATTYGPIDSMRGIDQYILLFWLTYAWRFAWDFVPFSFLYELYQHWLRTQAVEGLGLEELDFPVFGRRLAAAATATGEWTYTRRCPEDLMDATEPLAELLPAWKRPETDQSVHGYFRSGTVTRRGESRRT